MSRMTCTAAQAASNPKDPTIDWNKVDIDELVEVLSPGDIQKLLEEFDPDDPHLPPSERCSYRCDKLPTGPYNRRALLDYINEQAKKTPSKPDLVPYVPGVVRGKKWEAPKQPSIMEGYGFEDDIELDIELDDETEEALREAESHEIIDLAGILGFHALMNQDQYHASQSCKWADRADPRIGWDGITKATPLKWYPPEAPNRTDPDDIIKKLHAGYRSTRQANLNNVRIKEDKFLELFQALSDNSTLEELTIANTTLSDFAASKLAHAVENNYRMERLNIESNNVSPNTLSKIFQAANVQQQLTEIKAANQAAQYLGNKVEMDITTSIENNKTLLRVGLHFEYGDCRNRVAVQLQKNLDRIRLKRVAAKMKNSNVTRGGYLISSHPSGLIIATKNLRDATPTSDEETDSSR